MFIHAVKTVPVMREAPRPGQARPPAFGWAETRGEADELRPARTQPNPGTQTRSSQSKASAQLIRHARLPGSSGASAEETTTATSKEEMAAALRQLEHDD